MHRALSARWLTRTLRLGDLPPSSAVPLFLCPAILNTTCTITRGRFAPATSTCRQRTLHSEVAPGDFPVDPLTAESHDIPARRLPITCTGCGAFTQTTDPTQFGFIDLQAKRVKNWLYPQGRGLKHMEKGEDDVVNAALQCLDSSQLQALDLDPNQLILGEEEKILPATPKKQPVCDRCHNLIHHGTTAETAQIPMYHPTVESLRETIEESPHKYNHIYHVIDAADFPMSLIPRLNTLLGDITLRSRNRRSRAGKYHKDRKVEMSFIVTRGDLLAPTKEKVDHMMPYLREVLRETLGRVGRDVRLGNMRCVSAKRGWWTKEVKEDIWDRGGAGWMVGKVNVGKSQLFEAVYPKGRMVDVKSQISMYPRDLTDIDSISLAPEEDIYKNLDVGSLLPPLQPAKQFPEMPMVSSLPGTTASPIRIPFGNGKGELIDLPGLARSDLDLFVKPEHQQSMIMKSRIVPEQISVKPGNSIILGGGLIRITPQTPNMHFLMYNFTPLKEHYTNTEKAVEFQEQKRTSIGVENISRPGIGDKMKHAGTFKLRHDVTKLRAGPLTRKEAVGFKVEQLPFRVLSVDILIEGVGYVEIVAQVRSKDLQVTPRPKPLEIEKSKPVFKEVEKSVDPFAEMRAQRRDAHEGRQQVQQVQQVQRSHRREPEPEFEEAEPEPEPEWPSVDVFSPEGKFVGSRQPIHGWLHNKPLVKSEHKKSRPRKSMRGQKKKEKRERRSMSSR